MDWNGLLSVEEPACSLNHTEEVRHLPQFLLKGTGIKKFRERDAIAHQRGNILFQKLKMDTRLQLQAKTTAAGTDEGFFSLEKAPTYISTADIALPCELQIDTAVRNGNNINFFRIFQQICLFKDRIIQQDFLIANLMAVDIKCLEIHICTPQVMFRLHKRP